MRWLGARAAWVALFRAARDWYWTWPSRLADRLETAERGRHAGVDVSEPGVREYLMCLACMKPYPCDRLVALTERQEKTR